MLKENQLIEIPWTQTAQKYFNEKGYSLFKGKTIHIKPEELPEGSHREVVAVCDFCGKEITVQYKKYLKRIEKHDGKYCCRDCWGKNKELITQRNNKSVKTNLEKYGVGNPFKNEEVKNKAKKTLNEKYGVDYPRQIEESQEKAKQTCLKKYGVECFLLTDEIKEKAKQTCLEKYGTTFVLQTEEVKNKAKETCRKRYGCDYPIQNPEVRKRMQEALASKKELIPCSSQQLKIYEMLLDEYKVELNYPLSQLNLDVAIFIEDIKIDLEYDGWYWHQDQQKDIKRDRVVQKMGYKVLRIKGDHSIPEKQEIIDKINWLLKDNNYYAEIILKDYEQQKVKNTK